jgi:hypothetical protein
MDPRAKSREFGDARSNGETEGRIKSQKEVTFNMLD